MQQKFDRLFLVLPGWIAFILYLPSLSHGFVWDDTYFLTDLPLLRDPELWWRHIGEPLFVSRNYFRPLPLVAFSFEARLGGLDPFIFHFSNVMLHVANTTLVVLLARAAIPAGTMAALGAGLLFAVHPALVENVAWISDRFDLMMVFFVLLALVCDHHLSRPLSRAASVGVLFFLALLCKETAVVLIVLLPIWQAMRRPDAGSSSWRSSLLVSDNVTVWTAMMIALLGYLALRYGALGYFYQNDSSMAEGSGLQHLLLIGKTFGWYLLLALWPFGQMLPVHAAQTPLALGDLWAWAGLMSLAVVSTLLVILLLFSPRARRPALAGCMALVALAPVLNLLPLTIGDNLVQDRYLILPVAFIALALVLAWDARQRLLLIAAPVGIWLIATMVAVAGLLPHWESNMTLWSWAYAKHPESRIGRENYVSALVNMNRNEETVALARSLLASTPNVFSITQNLALALARLGQYEEAERQTLRAITLMPGSDTKGELDASEAYNLLGYIYLAQGRSSEAEQALRKSIALTPYLTRPHYNLALLLYERGDWNQGDRELAFSVRYGSPELAAAHQRLGEEKRREWQAKLR